jgi:hypothetical protein
MQEDEEDEFTEETAEEQYGERISELREEGELIYILLMQMSYQLPSFKKNFKAAKIDLKTQL